MLGCISGLNFNPNRESGFFDVEGELFPKNFNISFQFDPQHETPMGFENNRFIDRRFPYNAPRPRGQDVDQSGGTNADVIKSRENTILGD